MNLNNPTEPRQNKVLLVDDTTTNLQLMASALRNLNLEILSATNGYDAISMAMETQPELILLDIMMPEMDGYVTCEKIRADPKTRDIPILFITAKTDSASILRGFECGGQDYITKPFNIHELKARVLTHLELRIGQKSLKEMNKRLSADMNRYRGLLNGINPDLERLKTSLSNRLNGETNPTLLDSIDRMIAKTRLPEVSTGQLVTPEYLAALGMRLESLFKVNKIYRDGTLTSKKLAETLQTNTTYLSFLINSNYKSSIPQFINKHRIAEARILLADPHNNKLTIEALGRQCGFSSKTSFNRVFRDETGTTPLEFKNFKQNSTVGT